MIRQDDETRHIDMFLQLQYIFILYPYFYKLYFILFVFLLYYYNLFLYSFNLILYIYYFIIISFIYNNS